jgi:Polyketide cyclase / dehydrase and lipid transport
MTVVVNRLVQAARSQVWRVISDLDRWAELLPTVDAIERIADPGPIAVGTRFRVDQPRLPVAEWEVTIWRPDAGFTWESRSPGVRAVGTHWLRSEGAGTRLKLGIRWDGPLAPVMSWLFREKARRYVELEAATIAELAEGQARPVHRAGGERRAP